MLWLIRAGEGRARQVTVPRAEVMLLGWPSTSPRTSCWTCRSAAYENSALSDRSLWMRMIASANSGATEIARTRARS